MSRVNFFYNFIIRPANGSDFKTFHSSVFFFFFFFFFLVFINRFLKKYLFVWSIWIAAFRLWDVTLKAARFNLINQVSYFDCIFKNADIQMIELMFFLTILKRCFTFNFNDQNWVFILMVKRNVKGLSVNSVQLS